jgi:hypothetical protein
MDARTDRIIHRLSEVNRFKTVVNIPEEIMPNVGNNSVTTARHRLNDLGSKEKVARKMSKTMNGNLRIYDIAEWTEWLE